MTSPQVTFADLPLIEPLQRALASKQYTHPTPIQAQAIPPVLDGRDFLGVAQTGTGKTAAFALPILQRLAKSPKQAAPLSPRVLVLAPTRELASQISASFASYGRFLKLKHAVIYGGVSPFHQIRAMRQGVDVLIATPGRLCDLMQQGHVRLDRLEIFVLDEADRMLDMGFWPDLKRIMDRLPENRHSLFFSATMPPQVAELATSLLIDPIRVDITPQGTTTDRVDQRVIVVERNRKGALLRNLLQDEGYDRVLVFTKTKHGANRVAEHLMEANIAADAIHGNKSQAARERTLAMFRAGAVRVLVATDLAARGIDVAGVTHVINFDLPIEPENYVHRIGRTARAGATGSAIAFCDPTERRMLQAIERLIGHRLPTEVQSGGPELGSRDITERRPLRPRHPQGQQHQQAPRPPRRPEGQQAPGSQGGPGSQGSHGPRRPGGHGQPRAGRPHRRVRDAARG
ncbi:MAG TPA: DEAD/DEAH box helicase [Planctomycetaceae bacterium]|nr:DEAD/DEAH box helicase [Planctomycetaceae bacterium]